MIKYRLKLASNAYVGGMKYKDRYGRTKSTSVALVLDTRAEADAAAIMYGAWVEEYETEPLPGTPP